MRPELKTLHLYSNKYLLKLMWQIFQISARLPMQFLRDALSTDTSSYLHQRADSSDAVRMI